MTNVDNKGINDWLKSNAWSILIAIVGVTSTFLFYGFRIEALEKQVEKNSIMIATLDSQQDIIHVQLAQIATDIQYIKANIDRIEKE